MTHAAAPLAAGSTPASSGDGSPAAVSRRSDRLSGGGDGRGASRTRPLTSAARRFLVALVHAAALAALLVLPSGVARADAPRPPRDAADRNGDADGDGYTNLEEHLNGLVAAAFPPGSPARGLDGG